MAYTGLRNIVEFIKSTKHVLAQGVWRDMEFTAYDLWRIDGHLVFQAGYRVYNEDTETLTNYHVLVGDTYPLREKLQAAGYAWDKEHRFYVRENVNERENKVRELGMEFVNVTDNKHLHMQFMTDLFQNQPSQYQLAMQGLKIAIDSEARNS